MKFHIILLAVCVFLCNVSCDPGYNKDSNDTTQEIDNQHLVMATAWYQKSAEMEACYYQAFKHAEIALENQLSADESEKPNAVVLDIDETLLDNSPFQVKMIETGKPYTPEFWKEWTDLAQAKALPGAIEFLNYAAQSGVTVFYISNRREDELQATMENMEALGFPEIHESRFFLKKESSDKSSRRARVRNDYDILLMVGDNLNDYSNFLGDREENFGKNKLTEYKDILGTEFIILPNPMYGNWVDALREKSDAESYQKFIRNLPDLLDSY